MKRELQPVDFIMKDFYGPLTSLHILFQFKLPSACMFVTGDT